MNLSELIQEAKKAAKFSHSPYSKLNVGAALLAKSGKIYHGTNIESSSYGLTICAERVALYKALSEGESEFLQLAVWAEEKESLSPCGACRQVLFDYAPQLEVIYLWEGKVVVKKITELLPFAFRLEEEDGQL